jgi:DNA polymerase III epsilon subunit-like protein
VEIIILLVAVVILSVFLMQLSNSKKTSEKISSSEISELNDTYETESNEDFLNSFVVIDTETTGLSEDYQVIEIAIVDMSGNIILDERVLPTIPIEPGAINIHGITMDDLKDAKPFDSILETLLFSIKDRRIAGYNLPYDTKAIYNSAKSTNIDVKFNNEALCVMEFTRTIFKLNKNLSLTELSQAFKIDTADAHSAKTDAIMTMKLLKKLIELNDFYDGNYLPDFEEINPLVLATCNDGDTLTEWQAKDGRIMLFSPTSIGGSGRAAHLTESTIEKIDSIYNSGGDATFIVRHTELFPIIDLITQTKEDVEIHLAQQKQKEITELRSALMEEGLYPVNGSLKARINDRLTCDAGITYKLKAGEYIYLKHQALDEFMLGEHLLHFYNELGDIVAIQHLTQVWTKVAAIITSGYSAKVRIISETKKNWTSVEVIFETA